MLMMKIVIRALYIYEVTYVDTHEKKECEQSCYDTISIPYSPRSHHKYHYFQAVSFLRAKYESVIRV